MTHQFLDWLRSKPADEEYGYWCDQCAIGQFLVENGYATKPEMCREVWIEQVAGTAFGQEHPIPVLMDVASRGDTSVCEPHTFGAAASRLEKLLQP